MELRLIRAKKNLQSPLLKLPRLQKVKFNQLHCQQKLQNNTRRPNAPRVKLRNSKSLKRMNNLMPQLKSKKLMFVQPSKRQHHNGLQNLNKGHQQGKESKFASIYSTLIFLLHFLNSRLDQIAYNNILFRF